MTDDYRKRHEQYSHEILDLADKDGKALTATAKRMVSRIFELSGGNLGRLQALMVGAKKPIMGVVVDGAKKTAISAKSIGRTFGKELASK